MAALLSAQRAYAAQNIFSMAAVIIPYALPDEKIFNSPLVNPMRRHFKVSFRKPKISASGVFGQKLYMTICHVSLSCRIPDQVEDMLDPASSVFLDSRSPIGVEDKLRGNDFTRNYLCRYV